MYLKVYYDAKGKDATIAQVQQALPTDMQGLTVDEIAGSCTIVEFPEGAPYADLQKVLQVLQQAGFETE